MTDEVLVDTNVPLVASGRADHADARCRNACIIELERIINGCRVLVDDSDLILTEYRRRLSVAGQPGAGDAFFRWVWLNRWDESYVRRISITPHATRKFNEFPDDQNLRSFDRDDRKFVAVALAAGSSPDIVNATDTDWWNYRDALREHGVAVRFLCPELMTRD